ncbi:C1 family peptidase [Erysipelothrix rhusiopathiae]|uniref:aminopeptidase C n=1 Tax=Erysipelothrix rhusiopathiae TaxID=1648 RepID=UPI000F438988|nr:C1 family peptidase [Erysipelothrix rhusiopathiae]AYV34953.1 aminopeptidase [Erysipelothrix rhusiopathiae]MDE8330114.1 C1 family peptidase [Erysipelothrix rhusiopathiae]
MTISKSLLSEFKSEYQNNKAARTLENAVTHSGIHDIAVDHSLSSRYPDAFSVQAKTGQITNQKASGRCWMFASLNTMRADVLGCLNVDSFEFSETYPFFWDKLEKANYFLESILETKEEPTDGRLIQHLLSGPIQDGGQWDMFKGILEKYGVVPKEAMPETYHSSNSAFMNKIITSKLREFAYELRESENPRSKDEMLYEIYHILCLCLGTPPESFSYEYHDKDGNYKKIDTITPVDFMNQYVGWNLKDKVSIINAPTKDKPYGKAFTVKYLGTVKEADPIKYVNAPSHILKEAAIAQLQDGKPVWFGCDVGQMHDRDNGIMAKDAFDFKGVLNTELNLDKAGRLDYGDSLMTHAMVFVGVNLDENGKPTRWNVENSWGTDRNARKGYYTMTDEWFDEYNYQVMVDKKYVPKDYLEALESDEVIELEPWDPMGALALVK